jgi:hypothetical protein
VSKNLPCAEKCAIIIIDNKDHGKDVISSIFRMKFMKGRIFLFCNNKTQAQIWFGRCREAADGKVGF